MKLTQARTPPCSSDLAFDRRLAGESSLAELREMEAHMAGCARCSARWRELAEEQARFASAPLPSWSSRGRFGRSHALATGVAIVLAAMVLFRVSGQSADTRSKGGARLSFYVKHDGSVRLGASDERVASSDSLRFAYASPRPAYLAIVSVDGAGAANVYFSASGRAAKIEAGQEVALPSSVLLDETLGEEKVFGFFCAEPVEVEPIRSALASQPERAPVLAGCVVDVLTFRKEARKP
jgi:hypothetical protein